MGTVLDIVALRSLIAISEHGGFHRAAHALSLSQSAVSQHVRRLEKALGRPVVARDGRGTRFTPDGEALLEEARRVVAVHDAAVRRLRGENTADAAVTVGSTEHAADQILPVLADAVRAVRPHAQVRFRVDRSTRLVEAVERGSVDVAVYVAEAAATPGVPAGALPLAWYAVPGWAPPPAPEPLPLVAVQEPCAVRRQALNVLSAHGIPAAVVCDAGYLAGVLDATRAGLGAALLAELGPCPEGLARRADLPPAPTVRLSARARPGTDPALVSAASEAVRGLLTPSEPGPASAAGAPASLRPASTPAARGGGVSPPR